MINIFFLDGSFIDKLKAIDRQLFLLINNQLANPVFDAVLPFMRTSLYWAPLYVFLIVFYLLNFKKRGVWWILFFILTVALTDAVGTYGFKHNFMRPRPCYDASLARYVRLMVPHCSSGYSFVSNHAANHFGMGMFFYLTNKTLLGKWAALGLLWAAIIAFAQVYVGVHYPFDILAGSIVGMAIGRITGYFYNKRLGISIFD